MQADNKQRVRRIAMGIAVVTVGIMMGIPREVTQGTLLHPTQQELPVLTVCKEGPPVCQFAKIQDAIDAAPEPQGPFFSPTAEIQVAPGTYEENLLIIFKVVVLKGAGKDQVFLNLPKGGERKTPFGILIATIAGALIEGFTIEGNIALVGFGAGAHIRGNNLMGGISINASVYSAPIEENAFLPDPQTKRCAGIAATNVGRLQILRNTFEKGCGIYIEQARLDIPGSPGGFRALRDRVLIEGNQVDQIWINDGADIQIRKNVTHYIRLSEVEAALVEENMVRRGVTTGDTFSGIWIEDSIDVVIQKNVAEENMHGITVAGSIGRRASAAIIGNRVVRNGFGIVTESLEYITVCQGNEVKENNEADYAVGSWVSPKASPELKQKCEGG